MTAALCLAALVALPPPCPPLPAFVRRLPPPRCAAAAGLVPAAPALTPVPGCAVSREPTRAREVALTFDACETARPAGYDAEIVRTLTREQVPATFFLGGHWMWSHPEATRGLAAARRRDGQPLFELGNHTYTHPRLTRVPDRRLRDEVAVTQAIQYALTGRQGRWLRAPYGLYDARVVRTAGSLGLRLAQFDVVTGDPDPRIGAETILRTVTRGVRPGSVVIMHVNGRGRHTPEALPRVIHRLRGAGYRFVTMSELLADGQRSVRAARSRNLPGPPRPGSPAPAGGATAPATGATLR